MAIADRFRRQLIGLRNRIPTWQMPAALRALREQRDMEMLALRERHAGERFADKAARRRERLAELAQPRPSD